ncbi:MAG: Gfo/Idh/MocA family oxidoreductase [Nanoarchaeota archaeon]|nr:Gfo/Idh/MocA family oxidoreductase [Nanoarchaeota archaeon]
MVKSIDVLIIGGGMITNDQILPSIYHMQRKGEVSNISISALNSDPLKDLVDSTRLKNAFPGQGFDPFPLLNEKGNHPDLYKEALAEMKPRQAVVVALPDQLHYGAVMEALNHDQHVLCVKPLVLKHSQTLEIEKLAQEKGLFVGIEYHKRFDPRAKRLKLEYDNGAFGDFAIGNASMIEPRDYRNSNFQNWFTCENTDPFVYISCHYTDQLIWITGLNPTEVSVKGKIQKFTNGKKAYMWSDGRVTFDKGGILNVQSGLGYPDQGAGSNDQGIRFFFEGRDETYLAEHDDQRRGITHCTTRGHKWVSSDYFALLPEPGVEGLGAQGYGYESVAASINQMRRIEQAVAGMGETESLEKRQELIRLVDQEGLIATPANSAYNEVITEAARMSILSDGMPVTISYAGNIPLIQFKKL